MAARDEMINLVRRVRKKIGDEPYPGETSYVEIFSDDEIQAALDAHRTDVRWGDAGSILRVSPTYAAAGTTYKDFYADEQDWEEDAVLYTSAYAAITTATAEYGVGHWTTTDSVSPPVYVVGKTYDTNRAASELLTEWASVEKLSYDISRDRVTVYTRSQKFRFLIQQAANFAAKAKPRPMTVMRGDVNPNIY